MEKSAWIVPHCQIRPMQSRSEKSIFGPSIGRINALFPYVHWSFTVSGQPFTPTASCTATRHLAEFRRHPGKSTLSTFLLFPTMIAVVLSLVYVGLQLKQNTRAMKQDSVKNIIGTLRDATANLSQSEERAQIAFTGFINPSSLTVEQKFRSYVMFQNLISAFEIAYFQQTEGALEQHHWSGYQQYLIDICKAPGIQEYWAARKMWFRPDFS